MPKKKKKGSKKSGEVVCKGHIGAVYGICTGLAQLPLPDVHPIIRERKEAAQKLVKKVKKKKGKDEPPAPPLQFDHDFCGQVIASAGWDTTVALWSVDGGRCLARLEGHKDWVRAVEFVRIEAQANDGGIAWTHLVTGSWDSTVKLWDLQGGSCVATMEGHTDGVRTLAAARDIVVSGAFDKTIRVWRLRAGASALQPICDCEIVITGHKDVVITVALLDVRIVISGCWDGEVRGWDLEREGRCMWVLQAHQQPIETISLVSPQVFVTGSQDCSVRVWSLDQVEQEYGLPPEEEPEEDEYSRFSSTMLRTQDERPPSPGFDEELEWSDDDDDEDEEGELVGNRNDSDLDFDSDIELEDGLMVPEIVIPGCVRILEGQPKCKEGHQRGVYAVCTHEDFAITGSGDRTIKIWSLNTGQCHKTLTGHTSRVRSLRMATSAAGEVLVSSGDDRQVRIWPLHKMNYREPPVEKKKTTAKKKK